MSSNEELREEIIKIINEKNNYNVVTGDILLDLIKNKQGKFADDFRKKINACHQEDFNDDMISNLIDEFCNETLVDEIFNLITNKGTEINENNLKSFYKNEFGIKLSSELIQEGLKEIRETTKKEQIDLDIFKRFLDSGDSSYSYS